LKILVLGGDGFCGWPTALYLSARNHDVVIVDNLSRRNIDNELEASSLTPIRPIGERIRAWKEVNGKVTSFYNFDVAENYHRLLTLIAEWQPDAKAISGLYDLEPIRLNYLNVKPLVRRRRGTPQQPHIAFAADGRAAHHRLRHSRRRADARAGGDGGRVNAGAGVNRAKPVRRRRSWPIAARTTALSRFPAAG
jgi:hypothetical protein